MNETTESCEYFGMKKVYSEDAARISDPPKLPHYAEIWWTGSRLAGPIAAPLIYRIEEGDEGLLGSYLNESAPLFSLRMIEAMRQVGVDNLELVDAEVHVVADGTVDRSFKAVNVVGIIDAADPEQSDIESLEGMGSWIRRFKLDSTKVRGALVFRLRQSPSVVVVHKTVRDALLRADLSLVEFVSMDDFVS